MSHFIAAVLVGLFFLLPFNNANAADFKKPIEARGAYMNMLSFNLGLLGGMAKNPDSYDADVAGKAAANLQALANMNIDAMYPKGSDNGQAGLADKTRAKPDIWADFADFKKKQENLQTALAEFVKIAGTDVDGLRKGMGMVGKNCKGCHETYRAPKD